MQHLSYMIVAMTTVRKRISPTLLRQQATWCVMINLMIVAPAYANEGQNNAPATIASPAQPSGKNWQPLEDYVVANPSASNERYGTPKRLSLSELQARQQKNNAHNKPAMPPIELDFAALPPLYNATRLKPMLVQQPAPPITAPSPPILSAARTASPHTDSKAKETPAPEASSPTKQADKTMPIAAQCAPTPSTTTAAQQDQITLAALHQRVAELKLQDQLGFLLPTAAVSTPATPVPALSLESSHNSPHPPQ
jgi:hypothetical protein